MGLGLFWRFLPFLFCEIRRSLLCTFFCASLRLVSKKNDVLKSNQDKRLSGIPFGKPIMTSSVNHPWNHIQGNVRLFFLKSSKRFCAAFFRILYIFRCTEAPLLTLHKGEFCNSTEIRYGSKNTCNL